MSSQQTPITAVLPVRRTAQDQAADEQEFIDNMSSQAYKSWPNEAGVCTFILSLPLLLSTSADSRDSSTG